MRGHVLEPRGRSYATFLTRASIVFVIDRVPRVDDIGVAVVRQVAKLAVAGKLVQVFWDVSAGQAGRVYACV
jgi:hypothetical protein